MHAIPELVLVFHHLREGGAALLALQRLLTRGPLRGADLRHHDDLFACEVTVVDQFAQCAAYQPLAGAVDVVRRRVDEVDTGKQGSLERLAMLGRVVVGSIAAETQAAGSQSRRPELGRPGFGEAASITNGSRRGGTPGEMNRDRRRRPLIGARRFEFRGDGCRVGDRRPAGEVPADVERRHPVDQLLAAQQGQFGGADIDAWLEDRCYAVGQIVLRHGALQRFQVGRAPPTHQGDLHRPLEQQIDGAERRGEGAGEARDQGAESLDGAGCRVSELGTVEMVRQTYQRVSGNGIARRCRSVGAVPVTHDQLLVIARRVEERARILVAEVGQRPVE